MIFGLITVYILLWGSTVSASVKIIFTVLMSVELYAEVRAATRKKGKENTRERNRVNLH